MKVDISTVIQHASTLLRFSGNHARHLPELNVVHPVGPDNAPCISFYEQDRADVENAIGDDWARDHHGVEFQMVDGVKVTIVDGDKLAKSYATEHMEAVAGR